MNPITNARRLLTRLLTRLLKLAWIAFFTLAAPGIAAAQAQPGPGAKPATARATFAGGCFWCNVDPTQKDGQLCDFGPHYRTAIFFHDDQQKRLAEASRAALQKNKPFKGEIVTEITRADVFYPAEGYHQDFYLKNPTRYKFYKSGCGRDERLQQLWGKPGS